MQIFITFCLFYHSEQMDSTTDSIYRYFDRAVTISMEANPAMASFVEKLGRKIETGVNIIDDRLSYTSILEKDDLYKSQAYVFSNYFDISELGNYVVATRTEKENMKILFLIKDLLSLESVVFHNSYLSDGRHHFTFLLNTNDLEGVSGILLKYVTRDHSIKITRLGHAGYYFKSSPESHERMIAVIRSKPPENEQDLKNNPMGKSWLRMIKMSYGTERIDGVYLLEQENKSLEGRNAIVEGKMYSVTTENKLLEFLSRRFIGDKVVTWDQIHLFRDGYFYVYYSFQDLFRNNFIRIIHDLRDRFPEWEVELLLLQNMDEFIDTSAYLDLLDAGRNLRN